MAMLPHLATACGLALLGWAALHDVAARTVPNRLAAATALCGLAAHLSACLAGSIPPAALAWPLLAALAVFVAAALMWRRGWMGGGDVKLLAAAALLGPAEMVPALIAATALAGGVLALPYVLGRRLPPRGGAPPGARPHRLLARAWRAERWRLRRGGPMPYAVAIAAGALFVLIPDLLHPDLIPGALP